MRRFRVRLVDDAGNCVATSIQVAIPDSIRLRAGTRVSDAAKAYAMGRVTIALNDHALSEAILAGPDEDEESRTGTQA